MFDHNDKDLLQDIVQALKQGEFAGVLDSISNEDTKKLCTEVCEQFGGGKIALTAPGATIGKGNVKGSSSRVLVVPFS